MKLILTGSLAVDQIMTFAGRFEDMIQMDKLHVLSVSVLIQKLRRTRGGIAGNIAYSLALLGDQPILYAAIGKDQKSYIKALAKKGVITDYIHYSELATATFSVITDQNNCQVGGFYPGAMGDAASLNLEPFVGQDALVVISAHDPAQMEKQIDICASKKLRLCFDVGQQVIMLPTQVLKKGLAAGEMLILNDYEMGVLATRTNMTVAEVIRSVDICIITLGDQGCKVYAKATHWQEVHVPAIKDLQVVDPTGAGDAFRAGFLYGYVRGWTHTESAQLGSTMAAFAIEKLGTQEHRPTHAQIKRRYLNQYQQQLTLAKDA